MLQADALAPGLRLGRYELIQRIAVGGMAEIYLARATGIEGFEKLVVLKRILPQFATNESFVAMFLDEARLSATLQHPNIAQVHDIGQFGDSYFFTMEYVRGEDVRTILKTAVKERKRIPLSHCVKIIIDACAGLHAAHVKCDLDGNPLNIVHRDVSPSNVIVSYEGSVKLLDFGVAKAAQRQAATRSGTLKGKVSYMSPEHCRGKELDRRSDVFALGILLYELTLRRRLFKGESEFEIMTKIVKHDVEPPSKRVSNYPKQLELILMRALKRDRDERYASAQDMQLDLEDFAMRNRLQLSNVRLGKFMSEMFVDRMREIDSAITNRPKTEELDECDSGSYPDIIIETGDRNPTTVASGLAKRQATTGQSQSRPETPSEQLVAPRRQWPVVLIGAAAAAAGVFLLMNHSSPAGKTASRTTSAIPSSPAPQPKLEAKQVPKQVPTREPKPEPTPELKPEPKPELKPELKPEPKPELKPESKPEPKPAIIEARARESAVVKKRRRARARRRYYKRRARRKLVKKQKTLPKPKRRSWQLDSPLPPPR